MDAIYKIMMQSAITSPTVINTSILLLILSFIIGLGVIMHTRQKKGKNKAAAEKFGFIEVMPKLFTVSVGALCVLALLIADMNSRNASKILQTENWKIKKAVEINGVTTVTIESPAIKEKKMESFLGKTAEVTVKRDSKTAILTERNIRAISKSDLPVAGVKVLEGALSKNP